MAVLKPPGPRFQTERTSQGARVTLPPRRNRALILFNGAWLGGWAFGEFTVLRQLFDGDLSNTGSLVFLAFWLIAWTVGGAFILRAWFWNLAGREGIEVGGGSLKLWKKIGPFGRARELDLNHVKNLRVSASPVARGTGRARQIYASGGTVAFDYGSRTFHFGDCLDDAEATQVVRALEPHFIRQARATVGVSSEDEGLSRD